MGFYKKAIFSTCLLCLTACSTLNESMQLGAGLGLAAGLATVSVAGDKSGERPSNDEMVSAASIGIALGLLTSFLVHQNIAEKRDDYLQSGPEMHFGDLPPSPFIMDLPRKKKGGR